MQMQTKHPNNSPALRGQRQNCFPAARSACDPAHREEQVQEREEDRPVRRVVELARQMGTPLNTADEEAAAMPKCRRRREQDG